MILTREKRITHRGPCYGDTSSTTNPTSTGLGSNAGTHREGSATTQLVTRLINDE
jgi:hypothetical protein